MKLFSCMWEFNFVSNEVKFNIIILIIIENYINQQYGSKLTEFVIFYTFLKLPHFPTIDKQHEKTVHFTKHFSFDSWLNHV